MKKLLSISGRVSGTDIVAIRRRYELLPEIARAAVRNGFDGLMASEHHWQGDGYPPDALGLVTALGAVSRPSIIGTAIIPISMWHAETLLERAGMATALSGADVLLGVGAGNHPKEIGDQHVGMTRPAASLDETLAKMVESANLDGLQHVFGTPKILVGAMTRAGVRRAGRLGLGWLTDPRATVEELQKLNDEYVDAGGAGPVVLMRDVHIGVNDGWLQLAQDDHDNFWQRSWMVGVGGRSQPSEREFVENVAITGPVTAVNEKFDELVQRFNPLGVCVRLGFPASPLGFELEQLESWLEVRGS